MMKLSIQCNGLSICVQGKLACDPYLFLYIHSMCVFTTVVGNKGISGSIFETMGPTYSPG